MAIELNDMNVLSKEDIAFYLYQYMQLVINSAKNKSLKLMEINQNLLSNRKSSLPCSAIYYNSIRIFQLFLFRRMFSYKYDILFHEIREDVIKNIDIPKNIFVNKGDEKRFSKKQIIQNIRDGLNHNDKKNTFSIFQTSDKLFVNIHIPWTKPIPFHVQIEMSDLFKFINILIDSEYNPVLTIINTNSKNGFNFANSDIMSELNKTQIIRINADKNKNVKILDNLRNNTNYILNKSTNTIHLDRISSNESDFKTYALTLSQKLKAEEEIKTFIKVFHTLPNRSLYTYVLMNLLQFGSSKVHNLTMDYFISDYFWEHDNKCWNDLYSLAVNQLKHLESKGYIIHDMNNPNSCDHLFYRVLYPEHVVFSSISIFASYILDTYIEDEYVDIANKHIQRDKIRNSFVHGRFYIGSHKKYKLYDWKNGRKNEFEVNWSETIKVSDVYEYCCKYLGDKIKKPQLNIPITIEQNNLVYCVKNGITYFWLSEPNKNMDDSFLPNTLYSIKDGNIIGIDDPAEIAFFLEQINNLTNDDINKYKNILKNITECIINNKLNRQK